MSLKFSHLYTKIPTETDFRKIIHKIWNVDRSSRPIRLNSICQRTVTLCTAPYYAKPHNLSVFVKVPLSITQGLLRYDRNERRSSDPSYAGMKIFNCQVVLTVILIIKLYSFGIRVTCSTTWEHGHNIKLRDTSSESPCYSWPLNHSVLYVCHSSVLEYDPKDLLLFNCLDAHNVQSGLSYPGLLVQNKPSKWTKQTKK